MDMDELSELLVEADFLWREIEVGDYVQLEDPVIEQGVELLTSGKEYLVLTKECSDQGTQSFITESNIADRTVRVYPVSICDYSTHRANLLS